MRNSVTAMAAENPTHRRRSQESGRFQTRVGRLFLSGILSGLALAAAGHAKTVALTLQTRDPGTGSLRMSQVQLDPAHLGVVIVDPWNYHWCMTWAEQAGGMTPRMNRALAGARSLGMQVLWAPTDTAGAFAGWPQRQRAMAVPYVQVPSLRRVALTWSVRRSACLCGPGLACLPNYGHDGMDAALEIAATDWIVSGTKELYSICQAQNLTHLIYFGGATNICLTGKDIGLEPMYDAGLECYLARDLAFAWTSYDPAHDYTPTLGNAVAVADLERAGIATIHFADELKKLALWDEGWITEPVRITPAGQPRRPYLFEESVAVALATPMLDSAEIRYTVDGSAVTAGAAKYEGTPVTLHKTTVLHAAAFRNGRQVSLDGSGYFVRLGPMPPPPALPLDTLTPMADLYAAAGPVYAACLWQPVMNQSFERQPLRMRAVTYDKGVGMRAPAYLRYEIGPQWDRFVALAGIDDNLLDKDLGRNLAMYPSVVFKVFIDGQCMAQSPVMRISQAPWRFDVKIPAGSRRISLVADDDGKHSPYNLANWAGAGFVLGGATAQPPATQGHNAR